MNFWTLIYRFSWITLGILVVIGLLCMFLPQHNEYREYQRREAELREKIRLEEELLGTLRMKQERFKTDPRFVEQIAHDIGLARPEETIFKFIDDNPGTR